MDRHLGAWCLLMIMVLIVSWSRVNSFNLDVDYPIIFEDHSQSRGYFGFSLAMYSTSNESWILIGAPRANYSNPSYSFIKEPGIVYQCSLSSLGKCNPINLYGEKQYNEVDEDLDPDLENEKPFAANGFMGGSMALVQGTNGRLVICGPKTTFKWKSTENTKCSGSLGYCFWRNLEGNSMTPISPFLQAFLKPEETISSPFGASGFSVAISMRNETDQQRLLLGVPGFEHHQGAVSIFRDGNAATNNAKARRAVHSDFTSFLGFVSSKDLNLHNNKNLKTVEDGYDLLGYQVAVGTKGKNKLLTFFLSAPRANNLKGMVISFRFTNKASKDLKNIEEIHGNQTGEYFGASLATGDLNGDGTDDIIIGAPFYTVENNGKIIAFDEGRVEVHIRKNQTGSKNIIQLQGKAAGGHFGYAVSFLGRLCPNETTKIGVGAPYEEDNRGVVYIYSYDEGEMKETQRLVAQHINDKLRGFGSYIITQPSDIDENEVADIAVGAYKSGHAVVFRGKPVVKWKTKLNAAEKRTIDPSRSYFTFESCISFEGLGYIEKVDVERVLVLDPDFHRCDLNDSSTKVITVHRKGDCEQFNVTIKKENKNFKPVVVEVHFKLKEEKRNKTHVLVSGGNVTGNDTFCSKCPTTKFIPSTRGEFPFAHGCGDDNICMSDLTVNGYFPILNENSNAAPFLAGSKQDLKLKVTVENKGNETSYQPYVTVILPSGIDIQQIHYDKCEEVDSPEGCIHHNVVSDEIYIRCNVGGELRPSDKETVSISLDLSNPKGSAAENITVCTESSSTEVNQTDNSKVVPVHFKYIADITITGKAETEQFNFIDKKDVEGDFIDLNHIYQVQKFGDSPVAEVKIELFVPFAIEDDKGKFNEFLTLRSEGTQNDESLFCDTVMDDNERILHRQKRSTNEENNSEVNLKNITAAQAPSNRTLYLNCSSLERNDHPEIKCKIVNCYSFPLLGSQDLATVKLFMKLNTEILKKAKKEKDIILLETLGKVAVVKPKVLIQPEKDRPDQMWTSTMFIGDIPAGNVAAWIIIVAIIVGIILLSLLGFGLYKAGFFKRKKREELDSLKSQICTKEDFAEESIDNLS